MTALEAQSATLRHEAVELLDRIGFLRALRDRFGDASIVGSCALNLMTWRDIDIYVAVERSAKAEFVALLAGWSDRSGDRLIRAVFNEEWEVPRGDYGSGYYWGLRVRSVEGESGR